MKRLIALIILSLTIFTSAANAKILDIQDVKSPGGLTVWLVEDHSLPVVALTFAFRTGAATDALDKQGASQLLSNTLDEGAGNILATEFQSRLRDNAIDLSFSSARDSFSGSLRTLTRHLPEAETLLRASIMGPRFDAEAIDRMKAANIARIRSNLSDADWIAARLLNEAMYKGHPYATNTGGTIDSLTALTALDLRDARARHFTRARLVIGVTGDITPQAAGVLADTLFGNLAPKAEAPTLEPLPFPTAPKPVYYPQDIPQTSLSMAWPGIGVKDPDYYPSIVMNYIFGGGGFSSRLMAEVREKRGLTYGIYSSQYNLEFADRLVVSASLLPGNVVPAITLIKAIATDMTTVPVDDKTLKAAQDYLTGSLPLSFSSTGRTAAALADLQLDRRPIDTLDSYKAKILAVTPADIQRVASRLFTVEPIVVVVGAKPAGLDATELTTIPNAEHVTRE